MTISELKEYIYTHQKIELILNDIGCHHIVYHKSKDYFSCANFDGDNTGAINIKNNKYLHCINYTRESYFDEQSDILTLIQYNQSQILHVDYTIFDVVKYLHDLLGLKLTFNRKVKKENNINALSVFQKIKKHQKKTNVLEIDTIDEKELYDFAPMIHINWYREGIMPWTRKKFGLAYSYKFKRNVIPLRYWASGELMGFNMRTSVDNYDLFNIKKYFITPGYPKQMNIFGLWENKDSILQAGYVVVFESEKSVLKRDSLNDPTSVAISGKEISDEQAKILIGLNCEIIIALDKDVNINHVRYCCEKFYGVRKVSYLYDKWGVLGDKDSPADAKNKIYQFMMKYRTKYDRHEHFLYEQDLKKGK